MCGGHDTAIFTMLYLILLTLWFHKTFKLIFLNQSPWPKTMYALEKTSMSKFPGKFSYTFNITIQYATVFPIKNKFWPVILTFYFDLVPPFYFLKWNRFFSTFTPILSESRHYFNYLLPWEVSTNLQIERFPLTKFWYTVWMYEGTHFQSNNIEKQPSQKYSFFLKFLE